MNEYKPYFNLFFVETINKAKKPCNGTLKQMQTKLEKINKVQLNSKYNLVIAKLINNPSFKIII